MNDILRLAEFGLTAALIILAIALVCNIVVLTSKKRAKTVAKTPEMATVGGGSSTITDAPSTATAPASAPKTRTGLARYADAFAIVALILLTAYLVIRMVKTGHGPFANQHEFAVSFTWGILAAYVFVQWRYKIRILSLVVLPVTICMLFYATRIDMGVEPLVPALQNNTFLTIHVGFAVIGYGAACVSFASAVIYLLHDKLATKFKSLPRKEVFDELGYKAAMATFPLLTVMIVLGAIWADTAWGRYWGWDPKETAALVMWLIYGAFLHARVARGWKGTKSAWLLILGFAGVLFAYFGNYFLGGLHSYGG